MPFPDVADVDYSISANTDKVKECLDYAINQWYSREQRLEKLGKLYDSHNGIIDQAESESVTKATGKTSKTKFIKYRLGRTKLKQLHGEFLELNLDPTARSVNRDAVNKKMTKYKEMLALSLAKNQIEQVRNMGYNVFPGLNIPDRNDKAAWNLNNFILANELIMQKIINDKINNLKLKLKFYQNWIDLTIASEVFGVVERNINGVDDYRFIPVKYALFEESISDVFLEKSPYLGEVRPMFYHEILTCKEFDLDSTQKEQLKNYRENYSTETTSSKDTRQSDKDLLINTYTIEWKGLEPVYVKISPVKGSDEPYMLILSREYYNENEFKLKKDVREGKYSIEKYYREILWKATRIGGGIYTKAKMEKNLIQILNENNIYNVQYNYSGMLFNTIDGTRISLQEVIYELEKVYDDIRFAINREIKKIKGDLIAFDEAFRPKGLRFIDVFHSITEDGIVRYNSSAEGNASGLELQSNQVGISAINLGNNQNLIILLNQAMDIERTIDKITGMNENRQGLSRPTTTATANVNNIEASRSMTYDHFFFMQAYIEKVLTKLCEKTKINQTYYGSDNREFIFDDGEKMYLMATKDLALDNYGITITDGKKERDILAKIETLFPQEINAGMLRTKDVARFWMENSFATALRVLDNAHNELQKLREKEQQMKIESDKYSTDMNLQIAREDREDKQQHEMDMEVLRTEGKKEIVQLEGGIQGLNDAASDSAKLAQPNKISQ